MLSGIASWFGKWVVLPIVLVAAIFVGWHVVSRWQPAPKPAAERLADEQRKCLIVHVADDGRTKTQHRWMTHAVLNLAADTGFSVVTIHTKKLALSAPSQDGKKFPRYCEAAGFLEGLGVVGDRQNLAQAELEVDRILKERMADYNKEPCLAYVTRFYRIPKWGTVQDQGKMDTELDLLFEDGKGARFYGPKGSRAKCSK